MIGKKVLNYLDKHGISFDVVDHKTIYTAHDLAQTLRSDLDSIAKALLVKVDSQYKIIVLPAGRKIDFSKLAKALKAKKVSIPKEKVMEKVLKVKVGGITPFGALHKLETLVDKSLLKTQKVIMNAGSFNQSVHMKVKDFINLEQANLAAFSESAGYKKPKAAAKKKTAAKKSPAKKTTAKKKAAAKKKPVAKKKTAKKK